MKWIFAQVVSMSLTASIVIAVVCMARHLLRKLPKVISYGLWAVVLFRLLCPVSLPSPISFLPRPVADHTVVSRWSDTVTLDTVHDALPVVTTGNAVAEIPDKPELPAKAESPAITETKETPVSLPLVIWLVGMAAMVIYSGTSLILLKKKMRNASALQKNVFVTDEIRCPFVFGLIPPKIYLPEHLHEEEQAFIIAHEKFHIRHLDHLSKLLFFAALCIHWFNPLVWVAFALFSRDMEMRCDEAVVRRLGNHIKADYCASLLRVAAGHEIVINPTAAFGENCTKGRIRNLAQRKKTGACLMAAALAFSILLSACLATDPTAQPDPIPTDPAPTEDTTQLLEAAEAEREKLEKMERDAEILKNWRESTSRGGHLTPRFADDAGLLHDSIAYTYEGEELHVKVNIDANGMSEVGLLLFLNGKPQPYRLEGDAEYAYMSVFDQNANPKPAYQHLYLVPVEGNMGDTLDLDIVAINSPNYFLDDGFNVFSYTGMHAADSAKVIFEADPKPAVQPQVTSRVISVSAENIELTDSEKKQIDNSVDLAYDLPYRLGIGSHSGSFKSVRAGRNIYAYDSSTPLETTLEIWGDDVGEYGYTLFVNNIPVSAEPLAMIHTEPGKKTVVKVQLDMSDFDGSAVLYGCLAAKNYDGYRAETGAKKDVWQTETVFFSSAKDIYDLLGVDAPK